MRKQKGISLPAELSAKIQELADNNRPPVSFSAYIRWVLQEHVEQKKKEEN